MDSDGLVAYLQMVVAQAAVDPISPLLQYGVLGILAVIALLAVRVLFQREVAAHERERARADRLEEKLAANNAMIQERVITALAAATEAIKDAQESRGRV